MPVVLRHDDENQVLITAFVAAPNWQQLLDAGRIDHRTFAAAGTMLRSIYQAGLTHGRFRPDNILIGQHNKLTAVGWTGEQHGTHSLPDEAAGFTAHLVAGGVRQPYARDWYVEAARWFLHAAGVIDRPDIGGRVGRAVSDMLPSQDPRHRAELHAHAHDLIHGRRPLPW
jgi:hypothetical protein